jgi:chaperone modulatory protein CbpM
MDDQEYILVSEFCRHFGIEAAFITTLHEFDLIKVIEIGKNLYFPADQLTETEKIVRLHTELHINPEGLDAVLHLLQKIAAMQEEMALLKNKLRLYQP